MSVEQPVTFTVDEIVAVIEEALRQTEGNVKQNIVDDIRRNLIQERAPLWRRIVTAPWRFLRAVISEPRATA